MAEYLSLEDAAKKLGIPTDKLVELRSTGQIRGFRDGASWKFPETEIERLADELPDLLANSEDDLLGGMGDFGSGDLVSELGVGSSLSLGSSGNVIGGDGSDTEGSGSDVELGVEPSSGSGSDVNLITNGSDGSDVSLIANDSDKLLEIDSGELNLEGSAIGHDSAEIDLSLEPNAGSTGPVTDAELKELLDSEPNDVLASESGINLGSDIVGSGVGSDVVGSGIGSNKSGSDLGFAAISDEDSDDLVIGADGDSDLDVLDDEPISASQGGSHLRASGMSSLELMDELDSPAIGRSSMGMSGDVLSELDLLSAEQGGSSFISGDSENLLASSGLGSSLGLGALSSGALIPGADDALALSDDDDDDLMIAEDDDDDLVLSGAESDLSVAGDSGINLMSPSDSGLSLESEPLDLAGSSVSGLDLGDEISEVAGVGSSGPGIGDGSVVDFQTDEEFQLSPSGIGLEADIESDSQVIEVEDSELIGEPIEFGGDGFGGDAFAGDSVGGFDDAEPVAADTLEADEEPVEGAPVGVQSTSKRTKVVPTPAGIGTYEVPFTLLQCITLMLIIAVMSLGGMLMTDLVRNMWTYSEPSAPVSSLTDSLISLMGW